MKKSLLSLAVAAGMAVSGTAFAGDADVYGNVHISINDVDSNVNGLDMTSNTSHLGFKASEDLGDGMKAFAKFEFQPDAADGGAVGSRDAFVGLKGGMGTVKFGQFSSNYKQMGGKVDPFYRTAVEGRGGILGTQSRNHGGRGTGRGRMTNQLQFSSNPMGGMQVVVNTTFDNQVDESTGIGFRYDAKNFGFYADMITVDTGLANGGNLSGGAARAAASGITETATKFGGWYKMGDTKLGLQHEMAEDLVAEDYTFLSVSHGLNKNDTIALSYGMVAGLNANTDRTGLAVGYMHKMSKMTKVYVAYGDRSDDVAGGDNSALALGIQKKF